MTLLDLLLALASAAALAAIGIADPKRRRTRHLPPVAVPRRSAALGTLALCGAGVAASAGAAGVLVWASAVAAGGWALASALARLPSPLTVFARNGGRPAHRRFALPVALPLVALLCALLALDGRRGAGADDTSSARIAALALLDRIDRGASARRAAAPCLAALAAARDASPLRDLLSDRATTWTEPAAGRAGSALQRCILAAGRAGADVTRAGDAAVYALDADTAAGIHALLLAPLDDAEALAALVPSGGVGARLLCSRLADEAGPDVAGFVDALRRDRDYPKAADLLERLPALDGFIALRRAGVPCPA